MNSLHYGDIAANFKRDLDALKADQNELRAALQRLLRAFESDYEHAPGLDVGTCWETNSMAVAQARTALAKTEPKL